MGKNNEKSDENGRTEVKTKKQKELYNTSGKTVWQRMWKDRQLYIMMIPAILSVIIFSYVPMYGVVIAFQDFNPFRGFWHSEWIGFDNFIYIFTRPNVLKTVWNTLYLSILNLIVGFPAPIILALLINEIKPGKFKKTTQTVSYLPHFLSWMSVVGLLFIMFARDGVINDIRLAMGAEDKIMFLAQQKMFVPMVVLVSLWKGVGWGTIIHLANLSSINPELYEAAGIDGATRLQKIWYITLPHMLPTIAILLIFQMGGLFGSNFELIYGLQNPYIDFEVISTMTFKLGLQQGEFSLASAVGLTESLVAFILVVTSNWASKKVTGTGIA